MILENGQFTHAVWTDSNKTHVTAIWHDEENDQYSEIVAPVHNDDYLYNEIRKNFSIDEISTMTDQNEKEERENFKIYMATIAKELGYMYDPEAGNPNPGLSLDCIFAPTDDEAGEDVLFEIKIKIFDLPQVVDSENTELKRQLREASTPLEAFYIAGKFLFEGVE